MNYWERHIGDIIRDTVSLTMLEEGAYTRLLDQYYQTERPLPNDKKMIYRLARATSTAERRAVDFVIESFFSHGDDGYHQKRCDAEIARFQEKQRKAQASANARWNKSGRNANASQTDDAQDMRSHSEGNAHQAPDTNHQSPDTNQNHSGTASAIGITPRDGSVTAASLSAAMRRHGIDAQPADPRIIAAATAGISPATIEAASAEAKAKKPDERISAGYVLAIAERWTAEAARPRAVTNGNGRRTIHDERADAYAILTGKTRHDTDDRTIDADATPIG